MAHHRDALPAEDGSQGDAVEARCLRSTVDSEIRGCTVCDMTGIASEDTSKDYRPKKLSYKQAFRKLAKIAETQNDCPCCRATPRSIGAVAELIAEAVERGEDVHGFGIGTMNIMSSWRTGVHQYVIWVTGRNEVRFSVEKFKSTKLPLVTESVLQVWVKEGSGRFYLCEDGVITQGDL